MEIYETDTADEQRNILQIVVDCGADGILLYPMAKDGYVVVISPRLEDASFSTYIGAGIDSERMAALSCVSATNGSGRLLIVDYLNSGGQSCLESAILEPAEYGAETLSPEELFPAGVSQLKTRISDLVYAPFEGNQLRSVTVMDDLQGVPIQPVFGDIQAAGHGASGRGFFL